MTTSLDMEASRLCLHPYRKRKFFAALAELLGEEPPELLQLADVVPAEYAPLSPPLPAPVPEQALQALPRAPIETAPEEEEDSFELVDLGSSRVSLDASMSARASRASQSSMQDSLLFLPHELQHHARPPHPRPSMQMDVDAVAVAARPTTVLSCGCAKSGSRAVELVDYFDHDRYCEHTPCWLLEDQATCAIHKEPLPRPMLLFCLQALDEFVASRDILQHAKWLVDSCRLARVVLANMWEADVRGLGSSEDINLDEYAARQRSMPGISDQVWCVIQDYWKRHRPNFLHDQELFFADNIARANSMRQTTWSNIRRLLRVFGLKTAQAKRLLEMDANVAIHCEELTDKQIADISLGYPSVVPVQLGVEYLRVVAKSCADSTDAEHRDAIRDVISQAEWKVAIRAIEIHLKKWRSDVLVFPCGSFSRGAAYGSIIDILVGWRESDLDAMDHADVATSQEDVLHAAVHALSEANIIQQANVRQISPHRALAIVPFKDARLILDLKVYVLPQIWFALTYFTGPECFSCGLFSALLQASLDEFSHAAFDSIYPRISRMLGTDGLRMVTSEKHVFDLVQREYLLPSQRF